MQIFWPHMTSEAIEFLNPVLVEITRKHTNKKGQFSIKPE
jgi:hypothetical protein